MGAAALKSRVAGTPERFVNAYYSCFDIGKLFVGNAIIKLVGAHLYKYLHCGVMV